MLFRSVGFDAGSAAVVVGGFPKIPPVAGWVVAVTGALPNIEVCALVEAPNMGKLGCAAGFEVGT